MLYLRASASRIAYSNFLSASGSPPLKIICFRPEGKDVMQELSIQLWKINPCCPGTKAPMG
ncbi:MAG TPA: hypothetical protein ENH91_10225, partial [Leeuwenhoekiella sp.]|nr:hypothetical protein [Leeuwenhoekiella sp.]